MSEEKKTLYDLLEVKPTDDVQTIRQSWRRLSKECFPAVAGDENQERFDLLLKAWSILCDEDTRAAYDRSLED